MKHRWIFISLAWAAVTGGSAMAHEPGAHVHGVATLQVTQDQDTLSIDLDSPLDNLLGFEHAPRTDKQKQAVQQMIENLVRFDGGGAMYGGTGTTQGACVESRSA